MMTVSEQHLSAEQLAALVAGRLSGVELAAAESHLNACENCCRALSDREADSLVGRLRQRAENAQGVPVSSPKSDTVWPGQAAFPTERFHLPEELAQHPRYKVLKQLGTGGMGTVFLAEHRVMKRLVALKVLKKNLTAQPEAAQRFRREVEAAAALDHPNIVRAHDADKIGEIHFLAMEYVEGKSLAELVKEHGALPVHVACHFIWQAASGLQHASERGMVHRDIKPPNLMVTADGCVKILDFGLARFLSEKRITNLVTEAGLLMGTPDFMAPEQAQSTHTADIRADIYALGCSLYYLLAGRVPFPDGGALQKVQAHAERPPQPIRELRPDVPLELARVLERMMAKDRQHRFQTAAEVSRALLPFLPPSTTSSTLIPMPQLGLLQAPAGSDSTSTLVRLICPACKQSLKLKTDLAGKLVRCKSCQATLVVSADLRELSVATSRRFAGRRWVLAVTLIAALAAGGFVLSLLFSRPAPLLVTRSDVITGTVKIDYRTRQQEKGNDDIYDIDLKVKLDSLKEVSYTGRITRHLEAGISSPTAFKFKLAIQSHTLDAAGKVSDTLNVGDVSGDVPLNNFYYLFANSLAKTTVSGVEKPLQGRVRGFRGEEGSEKNYDPMVFDGLTIPGDVSLAVDSVTINGELNYDYTKRIYLTKNLTFAYDKTRDYLMGSIRWKQDKDYLPTGCQEGDIVGDGEGSRFKNFGRSRYEFTLIFADKPVEDIAPTDETPRLKGVIAYADYGRVINSKTKKGELEIEPWHSVVTYHLDANRLTPNQIHNFLRMWILMSGPVNDE